MPGTTSTALPSFSHDQHHKTDAPNGKGGGGKGDGGGGDNRSYKTFRAPVKSSPPTNQHLTFYGPDAFLSATNSVRALKGKGITFHRLAHPKLTTGYSNLDFDH